MSSCSPVQASVRADATTPDRRVPAARAVRSSASRRGRERRSLERDISLPLRAADERLLAGTRVFAAVVLLLATLGAANSNHKQILVALTAVYAVHAIGSFLNHRNHAHALVRRANLLEWIDLLFATIGSSLTGGVGSNVFPLFAFVLAASGMRGGLSRSIRHSVFVFVVALAQGGAAAAGLMSRPFLLDVFVIRVSYIVIGAGVLFGILAERQQAVRFHATALADLIARVGRATRLRPALELTLARTLEIFHARQAFLLVEECQTRVLYLWHIAAAQGGIRPIVSLAQLPREQRARWRDIDLSSGPCELRRSSGSGWRALGLDRDVRGRLVSCPCSPPEGLLQSGAWKIVLETPIEFAPLWRGRLYLCDPARRPGGELRLRFLHQISRQVAPLLMSLYLLRRLRSRAESSERARIARDLHDGVLQALTGIEMRVELSRRMAVDVSEPLAVDLAEIRDLLRAQTFEAGDLMHRLRSTETDATRLASSLRDLINRFSKGSRIHAALDWQVGRLDLSPRECSEVVRIVQEALLNVRRHSQATRVDVRVEADACGWMLIVRDNGVGFGFTGRLTHEQLDAQALGPRVMRERTAALGGMLDIESGKGGACIEMTFPLAGGEE